MGIKTYNPYTPSRRNMTGSDFSEITKTSPEKSLCVSLKKNSGRNNQGKITVRHRGGGSRRKYRVIDFKRYKDGIPATVIGIEYDPNRTANIALICYEDGTKSYILAPEGLTDGMKVMNGAEAEVRVLARRGPQDRNGSPGRSFVRGFRVFPIYRVRRTSSYPGTASTAPGRDTARALAAAARDSASSSVPPSSARRRK